MRILLAFGIIIAYDCQSKTGGSYDEIRDGLNARFQKTYAESGPYGILYATNREHIGSTTACSNSVYSVKPGLNTPYGLCRVQVPIERPVGSLSSTSDNSYSGGSNFQATLELSYDEKGFSSALREHKADEMLIFVHGFNVRFEEAIYRAAQLGFDGKYQGQIVLFSWPAGANDHILQGAFLYKTYIENKVNAETSVDAFERVLQAAIASGRRVQLVVHSMGHQVVLPALAKLADEQDADAIQELILNAPDYSVDEFRFILPKIHRIAKRTTIYCSPSDNALAASNKVNGKCEAWKLRAV